MRCGGRGGEEVSIIAKSVVNNMAWCRIAHLGGDLPIGVWILRGSPGLSKSAPQKQNRGQGTHHVKINNKSLQNRSSTA
eukprot:3708649-Rhodomonas_salina.1